VAHRLGELVSFTEMVRGQGLAATTRIRAVNELPAPDGVAAALELAPGAPAFRLQRVRLADGEPLTLEDSWVPAERFPGLLDQDLRGSLYALLRDVYDRPPARATERLEPVLATTEDAAALNVAAGAPLMLVERVAYDSRSVPVEFARDLHRADRARFEVEVRAPALV
jgi:GntR family transcriptional regulator